ncbi:electron transport complex subunit RsxD [Pseudomethylobacillus aquaticus]|uniref:Ion-translocating oxidoreductase complex subunit D n=1 Tax=Pseudomethylobacillus aquaticus TaxID=2676064 RepID=A0A3N0V7F3_9PROT|nr:electron transport complex subunit RsxD [Pseudomethylobacillus aquaticus]ROH88524.1 electron transport complex subunit RsxD [Pseudomethylobacillus aquaticus]
MSRSPYLSSAPSVSVIMLKVLLALLPGIATYVWVYGGGILISLALATLTALLAEAAVLRLRQRPVLPFLMDGSAIVTAWLLALALPPLAPWWLVVVGTLFAIVVAKQLYGGLGYNPFNPAMIGYAALLISFPVLMTQWPSPLELAKVSLSFTDQWHYIFMRSLPLGVPVDAISSATPLDYLKTQLILQQPISDISNTPIFGWLGGRGSELVALAYLLGGIYLLQQRIISWHIPLAFLATLTLLSGTFHLFAPGLYASPQFHLFSGAAMLCAFFIATDPVSGPTTPLAKLVFAAGIGVLTYVIRVFGAYPDGIAFAVILMNMCVPLLDAYTQPRVFGHEK